MILYFEKNQNIWFVNVINIVDHLVDSYLFYPLSTLFNLLSQPNTKLDFAFSETESKW